MADPATLIDALPYVDKEYEAMRPAVQELIQREMQSMPADRDYAAQWPAADDRFSALPLVSQELERIAAGKPLAAIDTLRYDPHNPDLQQPKGKSVDDWQNATDSLRVIAENERLSQINAELLDEYGVQSWKLTNGAAETLLAQIEQASKAAQKEIVEVNKKRKSEHIHTAKKLQLLETQWVQLVNTSLQAEIACSRLESEQH